MLGKRLGANRNRHNERDVQGMHFTVPFPKLFTARGPDSRPEYDCVEGSDDLESKTLLDLRHLEVQRNDFVIPN